MDCQCTPLARSDQHVGGALAYQAGIEKGVCLLTPSHSLSSSPVYIHPNMSKDAKRIVIVGGGLAGCSAVLAAHAERQASGAQLEIVLVEKGKLGGNRFVFISPQAVHARVRMCLCKRV